MPADELAAFDLSEADLAAAADIDTRALKAELEKLSDDLMVDISLGETL